MKLTFSKAVKKISTTLFVLTILFNSISCKMQEDPDPEILIKDLSKLEGIVEALYNIPEIVECHYTTGKYAIFVKVYARDNRHLLDITLNKISSIPGIVSAETFLMSLDEVFHRQLAAFDINEDDDENAE